MRMNTATNSRLHALLLVLFALIIYANSLKGDFVWDDGQLVRSNKYIKSWHYVEKIFTRDWGAGGGVTYSFYRPLAIFSYLINNMMTGYDVLYYHLTNVLLHAVTALVLYLLVRTITAEPLIAFLAGILFIVHPVHVEAVSYISGRADMLSAVFILGTLLSYIRYSAGGGRVFMTLSVFLAVMAALSKENFVILPLLILIYHFVYGKKFRIWPFLGVMAVIAGYVLLRVHVFENARVLSLSWPIIAQRMPGFFYVILLYMKLIFWPIGLHADYGDIFFGFRDPRVVSGLLFLVALVAGAIYFRKRRPNVSFGILWYLIALLPVSNIYPLPFFMADHYLYIPSMGIFLILADTLSRWYAKYPRYKPLLNGFVVCAIFIFGVLTVKQNTYWKDPLSLYERTLMFSPDNWRVNHNLALILRYNGDYEGGIAHYEKALAAKPESVETMVVLADLLREKKMYAKAINVLNNALMVGRKQALVYSQMSKVYEDMDRKRLALHFAWMAVKAEPGYFFGFVRLGDLYASSGKTALALRLYQKAIEIDPDCIEAYFNRGELCLRSNMRESGVKDLLEALRIDPTFVPAYNSLAAEYIQMKKADVAEVLLDKAIRLDPEYALAYNNKAVLQYLKGDYRQAMKNLRKCVELGGTIDPAFMDAVNKRLTN